MFIRLRIAGKVLADSVLNEVQNPDSLFSESLSRAKLECKVSPETADMEAEALLCSPENPAALLFEARSNAIFEKTRTLQQRALAQLRRMPGTNLVLSPVIVVFYCSGSTNLSMDLPEEISDWMFAPMAMDDLARRIIVSLKRKRMIDAHLQYGPFKLINETRSLSFEDRTIHLTPSEFLLADLFLRNMGAIIPLNDLMHMFKGTGRSTEANNIRVAIFQLRLKFEILTKSKVVLINVYKQGYCLRKKGGHSHSERPYISSCENDSKSMESRLSI